MDWIVGRDTIVRPDLVVVCGQIPERHLETPPAMVVEVLSDAMRERDRTYKKQLYEQQGVAIYLMVDPDTDAVELWPQGESGELCPQPTGPTLALSLCTDCHIELHVADLFKR